MTIPGPGRIPPSMRMSTFFAASLLVNGLVIPYLPVLLHDRGLTGDEIALTLAIPFLGRVVSIPILTRLADRSDDRRVPMMVVTVLTLVAALVLAAVVDRWAVMAVAATMLVVNSALGPLGDSFAMAMQRRGEGDYGRMRLWGSATFILGNLAGGWILGHYGVPSIVAMMVAGYSLAMVATFLIPPAAPLPPERHVRSLTVVRRPAFLAVLAGCAFIQASHAGLYGFATLSWQARGHAEALIGAFWAIGVIAEIILFALASRLPSRVPATALILASGLVGIVRWSLFPVDTGVFATAVLQAMHAGSFAVGHIGVMRFISESVPEERAAAAQGTYVILVGLAMAAATGISGRLWTMVGDETFLSMAAFCLIGISILLIGRPRASGVAMQEGIGAV